MAAKSKRLVIDASVASAASQKQHPVSSTCRNVLMTVLNVCHKIVITDDISAEWDRHQSRFSLKWRSTMVAKKKMVYVGGAKSTALRSALAELEITDKPREAMNKDLHLVDAALATDCAIVSLDRFAGRLFRQAAKTIGLLKPIVWVDPADPSQQAIEWLKRGAVIEKKRTLGAMTDN